MVIHILARVDANSGERTKRAVINVNGINVNCLAIHGGYGGRGHKRAIEVGD